MVRNVYGHRESETEPADFGGADPGTDHATGRRKYSFAEGNVRERLRPQRARSAEREDDGTTYAAHAARDDAGKNGRTAAKLYQSGGSVCGCPGLWAQNISCCSRSCGDVGCLAKRC